MRYMGGKFRIAKDLCAFLDAQMTSESSFVDLFAGSCNIVANIKATTKRYANDINEDIMVTMEAAMTDFEFPSVVTREEYAMMKKNGLPSDPLYGFMAYGCSFSGKRWGGYVYKDSGNKSTFAIRAKNGLARKGKLLQGTIFSIGSYLDFNIPANAVVYCDIPYSNTTKYQGRAAEFSHEEFYNWADKQTCPIYISEYVTGYNPLNLEIIWSKESLQRMRSKEGDQKRTTEVLFYKPAI